MPSFPKSWKVDTDKQRVSIELKTKDFLSALELFREIGDAAEGLEHHPDLHLETWNHVRIVSYSHDVGRLTDRDERLVAAIQDIVQRRGLIK